ncbi:MAG: hypothetical protein K8W52_30800 [Deltaproteobacteria bacterium]|nr:hypothetical protein [Deltaproteobacteria bacterium]
MRALAIALVLVSGAAHADVRPDARASAPAISALVTYDSTVIDSEGVTRTAHYQERMIRAGDQVWVERVMPPGVTAPRPADLHDLDLHLAARWFTRNGDGVSTGLVSAPAKVVIELTANEAADLSLPRRWQTAAELIDVTALVALPDRAAAGTRWYATRDAAPAVKVLWSEALRLPLVIETRSADGRASSRTTIAAKPLAASAPRPWAAIGGYAHKERSDLED